VRGDRAEEERHLQKDHGFVFEVSADDPDANVDPVPLTALGRFAHEAVVVDPQRGHLYLTEDAGNPNGLFFRFTPNQLPGGLGSLRSGGLLEAMLVPALPDLSAATEIGSRFPVQWKAVPDPLAATTSVRKQFDYTSGGSPVGGPGGAITRSRKLEGMWWGDGVAYFVASFARFSDGSVAQHDGQVWSYDPATQEIELRVRFGVNPDLGSDIPDGPDNITVSPFGGLILAEDGSGAQLLQFVDERGRTTAFARNRINVGTAGDPEYAEFTGPNFSPDGKTLFVCVQDPGVVFAIRGPWNRA
jgi:secreted PhoX family phosphatase